MCGCKGSAKFTSSTTKSCSGKLSDLEDARNKLAILQNHVTDPVLKAKYKSEKDEVNDLIIQTSNTGVCPSQEVVTGITNYVNNEYAKYYNT